MSRHHPGIGSVHKALRRRTTHELLRPLTLERCVWVERLLHHAWMSHHARHHLWHTRSSRRCHLWWPLHMCSIHHTASRHSLTSSLSRVGYLIWRPLRCVLSRITTHLALRTTRHHLLAILWWLLWHLHTVVHHRRPLSWCSHRTSRRATWWSSR